MMRRIAAVLLAAVLALAACPRAQAALDVETVEEADTYFERLFQRAEPVGAAVLVARGGERIYAHYYGYGSRGRKLAVDEQTVFKVASVSKLITAMGVMQLVEQGKLKLDAPLTDGAGQPIRNPYHPDADVTLRQAMSHTTSLISSAPYAGSPPWAQIARDNNRYFSRSVPGSKYEYANLNGGILCSVIERASGQSLNSYMAEHVFSPLGINAAYAAHLLPDSTCLAGTYRVGQAVYRSAEKYLQDDAETYDDTCNPDAHYRTSVGSLYISLSGLEKLGMALAGRGQADKVQILSLPSVREMRADQSTLPGSSVTGESPYGLCLYRYTADSGVTWYGHQGRWEGMLVDLFVEPESETVLVLVMNGVDRRAGKGEMDARAQGVIRYITPWTDGEMLSFLVDDDE